MFITSLKKLYSKLIAEDMRMSKDSADAQIDGLLISYQQGSIAEGEEEDSINLKEDEETTGDEAPATDEPAVSMTRKIDIDLYAQRVANLVQNHKNLLHIEQVIVNRAKNTLLNEGHSQEVADQLMSILQVEFGISPEGEDEEMEAPRAPGGDSAGPLS